MAEKNQSDFCKILSSQLNMIQINVASKIRTYFLACGPSKQAQIDFLTSIKDLVETFSNDYDPNDKSLSKFKHAICDEALFQIGKELAGIAKLCDYKIDKIRVIMEILFNLAQHEEKYVRNSAVDSINKIGQSAEDQKCQKIITEISPKIQEFFSDVDAFHKIISGMKMVEGLYDKLGSHQNDLVNKFKDQSNNQNPMVLKYNCEIIGSLYDKTQQPNQSGDPFGFREIFDTYMKSPNPDVVEDCLNSLEHCQGAFENQQFSRSFEKNIKNLSEHKSWNIRKKLAEVFPLISSDFDVENQYIRLLKDPEIEVKNQAIKSFRDYLKNRKNQFKQVQSQFVTDEFWETVWLLLKGQGILNEKVEQSEESEKILIRSEYITNMLEQLSDKKVLLRFSEEQIPSFRNSQHEIIKTVCENYQQGQNITPPHLRLLEAAFGLTSSLIKSQTKHHFDQIQDWIIEIIDDYNYTKQQLWEGNRQNTNIVWRIRHQFLEQLCEIFKEKQTFKQIINSQAFDTIQNCYFEFFHDNVWKIRERAMKAIKSLLETNQLGEKWVEDKLWPVLERGFKSKDYFMRITSLTGIQEIAQALNNQKTTILFKGVMKMFNDPVTNVQLKAIQVATQMAMNEWVTPEQAAQIKSQVQAMQKKTDPDISYQVKKSLEEI